MQEKERTNKKKERHKKRQKKEKERKKNVDRRKRQQEKVKCFTVGGCELNSIVYTKLIYIYHILNK